MPVTVATRETSQVGSSLWSRCVRALEDELPGEHFNTWVRPLQAIESNGALKLLAPNRFAVDWVNTHLLSILQPDGTEQARFPSPEENAKLEVPLSFPFDLAFNGHGSLLVTNAGDATMGNLPNNTPPPGGEQTAKNWVVYDVYVNDTAAPPIRPTLP